MNKLQSQFIDKSMIKSIFIIVVSVFFIACSSENINNDSNEQANYFNQTVSSNSGEFEVTVQTQNEISLPIGDYHNWIITVKTQSGEPVKAALFSISGGMPSHGHGLPTQPMVSKYLEGGRYLLEGVKFNMAGSWLLSVG